MKKKSHDLLAKLLNKGTPQETHAAAHDTDEEKMISVYDLVPNPENKYGMRELDKLIAQIKVSKEVEQLKVKPLGNGKYMVIAGHRRRAAVLALLKEHFPGVGPELSCRVKHYIAANGMTAREIEILDLILSNEQRAQHIVDEKLWKISTLRPIVKKEYEKGLSEGNVQGPFRQYFAPFMGMSSSALQRLESLTNLSSKIKAEVDAGNITLTAAAELASLTQACQDEFLALVHGDGNEITINAVKQFKASVSMRNSSSKHAALDQSSEQAAAISAETGSFVTEEADEHIEYQPIDETGRACTAPHITPSMPTDAMPAPADIHNEGTAMQHFEDKQSPAASEFKEVSNEDHTILPDDWVLKGLQAMLESALKKLSDAQALGSEIEVKQWNDRRAKVTSIMTKLKNGVE
jgi:ParB-like chromosome segregation protein Spo0J